MKQVSEYTVLKLIKGDNNMASIREVAKLAGVSPATVSRVINGTKSAKGY